MRKVIDNHWGLIVILLVSLMPLFPLFHTGLFSMHDDTQVARVFEMGKALHDGMLPVRWVQDLGYGYGYPIFTFYAPLAYYVGGLFILSGLSALLATKLMMGIGIILSGVFMYYFAKNIWGQLGGVVAGMLYLYAPYHALDIYVRGDVAEFWAYAFIPLAFLALWKIYQTRQLRFILLGAIGFAGIILSHNLTALMVTPFLCVFGIVLVFLSRHKLLTLYYVLSAIVVGLLLSAFYWFPIPFEMQFTNVISQVEGGADFHNNFVCLGQLWNSPWGYGGSIPGCIDGISFALGKIYIFFLGLLVILTPVVVKKDIRRGIVLLGSLIGVGISLLLLLQISQPLWDSVHVFAFLQYPWRFLELVFFFLSFGAGASMWLLEQYSFSKKILSFGIVCVLGIGLIIVNGKYFIPQTYYAVSSDYYTNTAALEWTTSRITDEYMPRNFHKPKQIKDIVAARFVVLPTDGSILSQSDMTQEKKVTVFMKREGSIQVNLAYFPAWHAFIDEKETRIPRLVSGVSIVVPQGKHTIDLVYDDTLVETVGNTTTIVTILIAIVGILCMRKRNHEEKNS